MSNSTFPPPPPELAELVEVLGPADTMCLIEARGGTVIFVPNKSDRSKLAEELGEMIAARLSAEFAGCYLKVPLAKSWRIVVLASNGLTHQQIARRIGCHVDTVQRQLSQHRARNAQLDMFSPQRRG
jgi:hypothetical protein